MKLTAVEKTPQGGLTRVAIEKELLKDSAFRENNQKTKSGNLENKTTQSLKKQEVASTERTSKEQSFDVC